MFIILPSLSSLSKHSINFWHSIGLKIWPDESGHVSVLYWPKWGISVIYVATALLVKFKSQTFSSKTFLFVFVPCDLSCFVIARCWLLLAPTGALMVIMCDFRSSLPTFWNFTQPMDAIDVTRVTPSRLNSINAIEDSKTLEMTSGSGTRDWH